MLVQWVHFIHSIQVIRFKSFSSSHSFQFLNFNSFMSIHSCQVIHVNSFISIHCCQVVDFSSFISIRSLLSFSSIHSFQFVHVNWFMSKHSFHGISFLFNSLLTNSPWTPISHVSFSKLPPRHVPGRFTPGFTSDASGYQHDPRCSRCQRKIRRLPDLTYMFFSREFITAYITKTYKNALWTFAITNFSYSPNLLVPFRNSNTFVMSISHILAIITHTQPISKNNKHIMIFNKGVHIWWCPILGHVFKKKKQLLFH